MISSVGDAVSGSSTFTHATIRTGFNNAFHMHYKFIGPGFWEALDGQSIKLLCIMGLIKTRMTSFLKFLQSLTQLDTLHIDVDRIIPDLWEVLQSLNIKSVTLSQKGRWRGV
ncbi:hypothetical protein DPMN_140243 [Dreissena polymorpha]|uniref:Uncharacterized protein n=1 Tax=Dreissena polymorpha TaxID=45954 RepID=A0A9D4GAM0_DREPO|nr:hypothetical protein DPMN_140243 [Dreissena polymorpha]